MKREKCLRREAFWRLARPNPRANAKADLFFFEGSQRGRVIYRILQDSPAPLWGPSSGIRKKNFEKNRKFWRMKTFRFFSKNFSDFHLSHRALGMSDFDARGIIWQEIIITFRILIKNSSQNDLHTKCTSCKKMRVLCLLCAHRNALGVRVQLLGSAHHLKV